MRTSDTEGKSAVLFADTIPMLIACECSPGAVAGTDKGYEPLICPNCHEEIFYRSWCSW